MMMVLEMIAEVKTGQQGQYRRQINAAGMMVIFKRVAVHRAMRLIGAKIEKLQRRQQCRHSPEHEEVWDGCADAEHIDQIGRASCRERV